MMHIIEIIFAIVVIDFFIVSIARAFEKFNRLKTEHKKYAKEFVELINDKDSTDPKSYEDLMSKAER